jgi:hypothetical protein
MLWLQYLDHLSRAFSCSLGISSRLHADLDKLSTAINELGKARSRLRIMMDMGAKLSIDRIDCFLVFVTTVWRTCRSMILLSRESLKSGENFLLDYMRNQMNEMNTKVYSSFLQCRKTMGDQISLKDRTLVESIHVRYLVLRASTGLMTDVYRAILVAAIQQIEQSPRRRMMYGKALFDRLLYTHQSPSNLSALELNIIGLFFQNPTFLPSFLTRPQASK